MLLLLVLSPILALAKYIVPLPEGAYGVSLQDVLVVDHNVPDPYLNLSYSRVPISISSPTGPSADCHQVLTPYMPLTTAEFWEKEITSVYKLPLNHTLTATSLTVCKPNATQPKTKVALLLPGAGFSRYFYNILATTITAHTGYTIITLDIPGQTEIVTFPSGAIQHPPNSTVTASTTNPHAINVIVQDVQIILNALTHPLPNYTGPTLSNTYIPILGHSQGGAAALSSLLSSSQLTAGINMDGGFLGSGGFNRTTTKPFMILAHQGNNQSTTTWADVWEGSLKGDKWQVQVDGTEHDSFGDYSFLLDLFGVRQEVSAKAVDAVFGSVNGTVLLGRLSEVVEGLFGYLDGRRGVLDVARVVGGVEGVEVVNVTVY